MHSDADYRSDVEEELFGALALLRSTDADSTDKLRKMLENAIRGKKMSLPNFPAEMMDESFGGNNEDRRRPRDEGKSKEEEIVDRLEEYFDDSLDREDIPRISIPDEGSNDGTLCKVCGAAKLGPMILLECQDCQEAYHPLCHYPPVIDIDVYDPRLVWRCGNCIETHVTSNELITDLTETRDDSENGASVLRKPPSHEEEVKKTRLSRSSSFLRKRTATGSQSKKRIGLKASINRTFAKG